MNGLEVGITSARGKEVDQSSFRWRCFSWEDAVWQLHVPHGYRLRGECSQDFLIRPPPGARAYLSTSAMRFTGQRRVEQIRTGGLEGPSLADELIPAPRLSRHGLGMGLSTRETITSLRHAYNL